MDDTCIHREIYQRLVEACPPLELEGPWANLPLDLNNVRRCPFYPTALLAQLSDDFTEADLISNGVARRLPGGSVLPVESLCNGGSLLALRETQDRSPFDILTEAGCLSGECLPLLAHRHDFYLYDGLVRHPENLLLGTSLADVIVLQSLGFPVALATGLNSLSREQLDQMGRYFGWRRKTDFLRSQAAGCEDAPAMESAACHPGNGDEVDEGSDQRVQDGEQTEVEIGFPAELLFVAWSISSLSLQEPPAIEPTRKMLYPLQKHLHIDFGELGIWRPDANALVALQFCLAFGDVELVRQKLLDSMEQNSLLFLGQRAELQDDPNSGSDYSTAVDNLRRLARQLPSGDQAEELLRARLKFDDMLDRDLIAPLISQSMAENNLVRRNLRLSMAEICRRLHRQLHLANEDSADGSGRHRGRDDGHLAMTQMKQNLSLVDRVVALAREIRK